MSEAFITFREILEAALIIATLGRYTAKSQWYYIGIGIFSAVILSGLAALILHHIALASALREILLSIAAATTLIHMVGWMRRHSRLISQELAEKVHIYASWQLSLLSFLSVAREGMELAIFLRALWHTQEGLSWFAAALGVIGAIIIGILIFVFSRKVPLAPFFKVTSILLLAIASGMMSYTTHELIELGKDSHRWIEWLSNQKAWSLFPPTQLPPLNEKWIYAFYEGMYYHPLHHKGWIGGLLNTLMGWLSYHELAGSRDMGSYISSRHMVVA
ncbi:MAG: FTR1 family protein [Bacteroidia bacterium]|nr:FTR1 family protein [Bacteroidia bacterium]MDW8134947.1 FTR1 family protein [Bacteroidia bacterium]